jgi:hypothetical protein
MSLSVGESTRHDCDIDRNIFDVENVLMFALSTSRGQIAVNPPQRAPVMDRCNENRFNRRELKDREKTGKSLHGAARLVDCGQIRVTRDGAIDVRYWVRLRLHLLQSARTER